MFAKKQRLTKKEFDYIYSVGKRYHSPLIQLIHYPTEVFHGAVVVGKKVYKKAVKRNKLRRQLYGFLYRRHKKNPLSGSFIFIAKPTIQKASQDEISESLLSLIQQVEKNK